MKKGFSLLMAIVFMIILAILGTMAMNFSTATVKQTTDVYLREQAEILAVSAAEFAIMAMQVHDYAKGNCLESVTINYPDNKDPLLVAKVDIYYIDSRMKKVAKCKDARMIVNNPTPMTDPDTQTYEPTALFDINVQTLPGVTTEPIRFFRRTIQRL